MEPIPATEPLPEHLSREPAEWLVEAKEKPVVEARVERSGPNLWRVTFEAGHAAPRVLYGRSRKRLSPRQLARQISRRPIPAGYRPPWCAQTYFPRFLPYSIAHQSPRHRFNFRHYTVPAPLRDRVELIDYSYPLCTVGKIFAGSGSTTKWRGSGVLVGPNLLLTASHNVPWDDDPWFMKFVPAYSDRDPPPGQTYAAPYGESFVSQLLGVENTDEVTALDYVICRLYTRVGENAGWMGSYAYGDDNQYRIGSWTSVGYPGDFFGGHRPALELWVTVDDVDQQGEARQLETRIFTTPGWSGGPIWRWIEEQPRVGGVLSGEEKDDSDPRRDAYAGGKPMVDLVKFGFANWP